MLGISPRGCASTVGFRGTSSRCDPLSPCPTVSTLQLEPAISTLPLLTVQLVTPHHFISVPTLMDPGSSGNFISLALIRQLDLPRQRQAELKIQAKLLGHGHIKFRSPPISVQVGGLHQERISFLVLKGPTLDIISTFPQSQMGYQRDPPME